MKKRIFIAIQYLEIGGAERALIGLLNAIDYSMYHVDLFLYQHTGEFMKLIPQEVHLLPEIKEYSVINKPIINVIKTGYFNIAIARVIAKLRSAIYNKKHPSKDSYAIFQYVANCISPFLPSLKKYGCYDLAISFLTPHNIVKNKVLANKKIAWIHTDYSTVSVNTKLEYPIWKSFNSIISISNDVTRSFLTSFPNLKEKIIEIENILSPTFVRQQAKLFDARKELNLKRDEIILCSVGRFTRQKNFENIPYICKELIAKGLSFKWFLIGYGGEEHVIKNNIIHAKVKDSCIILGKKENPYPYIDMCNIYIQPSRYEGKAVTVREAQILHKPTIITNYATSTSQIQHNVDGYIVPIDNSKIAEAIYRIIKDTDIQQPIIRYLKEHDYGNENEINKIYKLF